MPTTDGTGHSRASAVRYVVLASLVFAVAAPLARWARPLDPVAMAFGRCALAAAILFALDCGAAIGAARTLPPRMRLAVACAGTLLAAHFALFLTGLDRTSLPAALSLVSLEPLAVVLAAWGLHRVRPTRMEAVGVAFASAGAALVARGAGEGEHRLVGDVLVAGAVVLFGFYVAIARTVRDALTPQHYAALVYGVAAVVLALALPLLPAPEARVLWPIPMRSALAVVGLAVLPTVLGHTMVQTAARSLPPAVVALVSPGETVLGICIGAVALGAIPTWTEIAGGTAVVGGATITILGRSLVGQLRPNADTDRELRRGDRAAERRTEP